MATVFGSGNTTTGAHAIGVGGNLVTLGTAIGDGNSGVLAVTAVGDANLLVSAGANGGLNVANVATVVGSGNGNINFAHTFADNFAAIAGPGNFNISFKPFTFAPGQ